MFVDLRMLEDKQVLETDVCIVGAGPAGITIASDIDHKDVRVCLIESGDVEANARNQDLADGDMVGYPNVDLRTSRDRRFGGSSNSWAGACAPMSRSDFDDRPWIALEGWPYPINALDAHYERAQTILQLGPYRYDPAHWTKDGHELLDLRAETLEHRIWQLGPRTNFGKIYRKPLEDSQTTTVLLNATATEILTDDGAETVTGVEVRTLDGKRATITARFVILACGAIDNARLLLLSRRHVAAGLGNGHDLVGRYFSQHPHISAASLRMKGRRTWTRGYKDFKNGNLWLRTRIGLSDEARRRHRVLNPVATLINRFIADSLTHSQSIGYVSLKRVLLDLRHRRVPVNFTAEVARIVKDIRGIAIGAIKHLRHQTGALHVMSEQFPNPESRVTLGNRKDAFGLEQARVDWRLLPIDKRSILVLIQEIQDEFARLEVGEVRPDNWLTVDDRSWPDSLAGGHHHMGTTRMSDSPRKGVVDADARVHGTNNLYVAGSSIFPTTGSANPTLTLVATSLKLADHLRAQIAATGTLH